MTAPLFGYTSALRDELVTMKIVADRNANCHSLPDKKAETVIAIVNRTTEVFAGNEQKGMRPVRIECWISAELLEAIE